MFLNFILRHACLLFISILLQFLFTTVFLLRYTLFDLFVALLFLRTLFLLGVSCDSLQLSPAESINLSLWTRQLWDEGCSEPWDEVCSLQPAICLLHVEYILRRSFSLACIPPMPRCNNTKQPVSLPWSASGRLDIRQSKGSRTRSGRVKGAELCQHHLTLAVIV